MYIYIYICIHLYIYIYIYIRIPLETLPQRIVGTGNFEIIATPHSNFRISSADQ